MKSLPTLPTSITSAVSYLSNQQQQQRQIKPLTTIMPPSSPCCSSSCTNNITTPPSATRSTEDAAAFAAAASTRIARNRTNMTILHFLITYPKWSVSLFLFLASRSLPLPSVDDAIHRPLQQLKALVHAESNAYSQCVIRSFQRCTQQMNSSIQQEDERISKTRMENIERLEQNNLRNILCRNLTQSARNALQAWSQVNTKTIPLAMMMTYYNTTPTNHNNNNSNHNSSNLICTSIELNDVTKLIQDGVVAVQNDVLSDMNSYVSNSDSFTLRLAQYARNVTKYNYNYFIKDKVQPVVQILEDIASSPFKVDLPLLQVDALEMNARIGASLQGIKDVLQDAANQMNIIMDRLQEFDTSITNFHVQYMRLYHNMAQVISFVQGLSLGLPLPSYFDMGSIPLADSLLPSHFDIPQFHGGILSLPDVPNLMNNATRQVMEELDQVIEKLVQQATTQVRLAEQGLAHQLQDMLTLEDYHPPVFTGMEEEMSVLHDQSQQTMVHLKNGLNQLWTSTTTSTSLNDDGGTILSSSPSDLNANVTFSTNTSDFDYLQPQFPSLSIPQFVVILFGWFLRYMWLTELCLQGFRLWRLDSQYGRNATPDLPEIDCVTNGDHDDSGSNSNNNSQQQDSFVERKLRSFQLFSLTILKYMCCNFWMILALFTVPLGFTLSCLLYPHYRANCVLSKHGTFVARHLWAPIVVNDANVAGNALLLWHEAQFVTDKTLVCNRNYSETSRFHHVQVNQYEQTQHEYNQTMFLMSLLHRCVDYHQVDTTLNQACCGLKGYGGVNGNCRIQGSGRESLSNWTCPIDNEVNPPAAYLPIQYYLSHPSCQPQHQPQVLPNDEDHHTDMLDDDSLLSQLDDSRFNCEVLPQSCHVPCRSVDVDWILHHVVEADCAMQGYYFGCIFLFLVALYHAVMLNMWTTLLFHGIKCLWWRQLNPNGLVLKTRIYEDGTLCNSALLQQDRSERIRTALRRFQMLGYLQLSLGLVIMLGWMLSFVFLSTLMAF